MHIPPLRERKEDIPDLIYYYINEYNKRLNKNILSVEDKAMEILKEYDWPGNVRQLKNFLERTMII